MRGKERILAKLRGEPTDSLPLMPITMMFAGSGCEVPRGTPHANLEAMARFARSRR